MKPKQCPFCKGESTKVNSTGSRVLFWVNCDNCSACGPVENLPELAVKVWNGVK